MNGFQDESRYLLIINGLIIFKRNLSVFKRSQRSALRLAVIEMTFDATTLKLDGDSGEHWD